MKQACHFLIPLDPTKFFAYYQKVPKPRWFQDVDKKVTDRKYKHRYELYQDIRQVKCFDIVYDGRILYIFK